MRSFQLFGLALSLSGIVAPTFAAEKSPAIVHVSTKGDDAHDGSAARPLATIAGAQQLVRKLVAGGDVSAVRVEIASGEYFLAETLKFAPIDSSLECPVTYAGAADGVVISGGFRVTEWRQGDGHWEATVPPFELDNANPSSAIAQPTIRDLWINGRRATRARAPNEGFYRVEEAGSDNRTSFVVAPADLLRLAHPERAEVGFLHDWSMSRIRLAAIDAATRSYRFDDPIGGEADQFAITNFEPHPRYLVENAPELLDAPGEWYFDEATRALSYVPCEGESIDQTVAVVPLREQLLVVRGEADEPVTNLAFEGLTFSHTRFDLPPHGYAGIQSSMYERRASPDDKARLSMTAAVLVDGAEESCRFSRCRFEGLAACGLHLARNAGVEVYRCEFRDIGGDGVMIGSRDPGETPVNENSQVSECIIEDCGVTFHGAVGIWIGFARAAIVQNNELRNLPYTGVSVGWQWNNQPTPCQGHSISRNHIHHVMQLLSDGGGIYTLGLQPGTNLTENVIHDVTRNAGRAESNGIFMDEGSTSITVEGNLIYNIATSPIRFHRAGANKIVSNRLVSAPGIPAFSFLASDQAAMTFEGNNEMVAEEWKPAANDPAVLRAGPRPAE
jgi:hypothetical protein